MDNYFIKYDSDSEGIKYHTKEQFVKISQIKDILKYEKGIWRDSKHNFEQTYKCIVRCPGVFSIYYGDEENIELDMSKHPIIEFKLERFKVRSSKV